MQWSAAANGGFSRAPSKKLVAPVISEDEYRYEQVNVAAQRLNGDSLLNWTERAVRTRKECPEFGWGELQFLETDQREVLAHACTWRGETVAAIHNFGRARRSVRVSWPSGTKALHQLFGRNLNEQMASSPDIIDLDGYDYRWVRIEAS